MLTLATVRILALSVGLLQASDPQGLGPYQVEWESDALRVVRVILSPGQRATAESSSGAVMVFLTADLNGRIPASEAAWQDPGPVELENHGPARFEAIIIQFKQSVLQGAPTPAVQATYSARSGATAWPFMGSDGLSTAPSQ